MWTWPSMSWSDSFAASRPLSGHSRPARTNVKHANDARCVCFCNRKQQNENAKRNSQSPPSLPLLPPYISSFKSCSLKKKKKRKVCRLFSLFIISWRLSRAQRKNGKCPQVIAKSAQITFFFTYIFFDVDSFCPPPPFQCFNKKKKENNFAAVL